LRVILNIFNHLHGSACACQRLPRLFWHLALALVTLSLPFSLEAAETKEDLPNFHTVHSYLFRGGEPSAAGLKKLQSLGVKTIIDLRAPSEEKFNEKKEAEQLGMRYLNLPMTSAAPTSKQVSQFDQAVSQAEKLSLKAGKSDANDPEVAAYTGSLFVHCAHGSDRTGCMVGIWRVTHDQWSYQKAYDEMRKYYFGPKYKELANAVRTRAAN
jgi:protein tyrosine/serine phosphatase